MKVSKEFKQKMEKLLGENAPNFFTALETPCKKAITINYNRISDEKFSKLADFQYTPIKEVDNGRIVENLKVGSHILNHLGAIYSQ